MSIFEVGQSYDDLKADRDNLRAFIENIIRNECWDQGEYLDGGSVQDEAERMGILRQVPHEEPCEIEGCPCREYGPMDYLYQFTWKP